MTPDTSHAFAPFTNRPDNPGIEDVEKESEEIKKENKNPCGQEIKIKLKNPLPQQRGQTAPGLVAQLPVPVVALPQKIKKEHRSFKTSPGGRSCDLLTAVAWGYRVDCSTWQNSCYQKYPSSDGGVRLAGRFESA